MATTKKDLQARIAELESELQTRTEQFQDQVSSLQDELAIKCDALLDATDAVSDAHEAVRDAQVAYQQLDYERTLTNTLVSLVDDMSRQFRWALSMFDTISLYTAQDGEAAREEMLTLLTTETDAFVDEFEQGLFDANQLLPEIQAERDQLSQLAQFDITDVTDLLSTFLGAIGVEETEVDPDPTPFAGFSFSDVRTESAEESSEEPTEPTAA